MADQDGFKPEVNNIDRSELIVRLAWLKDGLKLTKNEQARIIPKYPTIVKLTEESLGPKCLFLEKRLGLQTKGLAKIIQTDPSIMGRGIGENQPLQRNLNWMETSLNLTTPSQMEKVINGCPSLLYLSVEKQFGSNLQNAAADYSSKDTCKGPNILACSTASLESKLDWFQDRFNVDRTWLGKKIKWHPQLLLGSLEDAFEPKRMWLQERLCLDDESLRKLIVGQPQILSYSNSTKIEPVLQWLQENLDLEDPQGIAEVMVKFPGLFCYSITDNLEPTLNFYKMCLGDQGAVELVTRDPSFFSRSLKGRLEPRLEQLEQLGVVINKIWIKKMGKYTKEQWEAALGKV